MPVSRTPKAIAKRLQQALAWSLKSGNHNKNSDGNACVMEAVAFVAGRPWSDKPPCVSPVLGSFMRAWNDGLPNDEERDRLLKPFIPKLIGTAQGDEAERRRGWMAQDWLIRAFTPKWLDLVPALQPHATALRDLEEIADVAGILAAQGKLSAARKASSAAWAAARDAAWDAARDAAGDAARDAAGAAAWAAAWDAAWAAARDAAWDAARDAAGAAAWDAAGAAARDAARDVLKPIVAWLQVSATDLAHRMIAVAPGTLEIAA